MAEEKKVWAFDQADLHRWERRFEMEAPSAKDRVDATDCPHAVSLRSQASAYGIAVKMRLADGSETEVFLNVLVARALAMEIIDVGARIGWMKDPKSITIPLIPAHQKRKV